MSSAPEDADLEVRPFRGHPILGEMMPGSKAALSWTRAKPGQRVHLRSHDAPSLLIVLQGKAALLERAGRSVAPGDVITVPSRHVYGFTAIGEEGLEILQVAFSPEDTEGAAGALGALLSRNEERGQILLNGPFFEMLRSRRVSSPRERAALLACLRVFADAFQRILFTRQATCRDQSFYAPFLTHLSEEIGHNELLRVPHEPRIMDDPILQATAHWFCHRMLVLDNAGKAVVNLVLETAGEYLGVLAGPIFADDASAGYFDLHAGADAEHKDVGSRLLENLHPEQYVRLTRVLDDTWSMLDAMTTRFVRIVEHESLGSSRVDLQACKLEYSIVSPK